MTGGGIVLITRPLEDALPVARAAEEKGFPVFIEPMMTIRFLDAPLPDLSGFQGLVFTSASGVRAFVRAAPRRDLPVYAVGRDTAREALESGFETLTVADGGVDGLAALADGEALARDGRPLLHPSGVHVAKEARLPGCRVERVPVYEAQAAASLTPRLLELLDAGAVGGALFFSPRAAGIFAGLLESSGRVAAVAGTRALCMADSVVKSLERLPWLDVLTASGAGRRGMLELLDRLPRGNGRSGEKADEPDETDGT